MLTLNKTRTQLKPETRKLIRELFVANELLAHDRMSDRETREQRRHLASVLRLARVSGRGRGSDDTVLEPIVVRIVE